MLGAATANVVRWLADSEEKPDKREDQPEAGHENDSDAKNHTEYVRHRLREIRSWEKRVDGRKV